VASKFRAWDDYYIPGTTVLKNRFKETDQQKLTVKEEFVTRNRLAELAADPIPGNFDYDHMKAIHRYVFQDAYEWAGEERVGPNGFMVKEGHAYYPAGPALTENAHAQYAKLAEKDFLRGLDKSQFVDELAERWGEINVIHSFREGNTRTQFVFFSQLAENAGYRLDTEAFKKGSPLRDEFVAARFHSQDTSHNDRLAAVLSKAIEPIESASAAPPPLSPELQRIIDLNRLDHPTNPNEIRRTENGSSKPGQGYRPPQQGLDNDHGYGR
jgi:cell filamentation protein